MKTIVKTLFIIYTILISSISFAQERTEYEDIKWSKEHALNINAERPPELIKEEADDWGNAGIYSSTRINGETNGEIAFNLQETEKKLAIGLSEQQGEGYDFKDLKYAFLFEGRSCVILFDGKIVGEISRFSRGDFFQIKKRDNLISYSYNRSEVFAEELNPSQILYGGLIVFSSGSLVQPIQTAGFATPPPGGGGGTPPPVCLTSPADYNRIEAISYDLDGNVIAHSKTFSNKFGKLVQSQSKDFVHNKVMASQPVYDAFGRPVLQTLAAPILGNSFCVNPKFIEAQGEDTPYSYSDFDLPNTTGAAYSGEIDHPKRVEDDDEGSVGWYYSHNNNEEEFVDRTDYPYSRIEYSKSNPGQVRRSSSAGNELRMGKGKESETQTMAAAGELYYVYGYAMDWNSGTVDGSGWQPSMTNVDYQVVKTITKDGNGDEFIGFTDHDGKTLATCRSGLSAPIQTVHSVIPNNGFVDIHLPNQCESSLVVHWPSLSANPNYRIRILDLSTDKFIYNSSTSSNLFKKGNSINLNPGYYRLEHVQGSSNNIVSLTYELNYEQFTLHYYDNGKRLIRTIPPKGIDESYTPNVITTNLFDSHTFTDLHSGSQELSVTNPNVGVNSDLEITNLKFVVYAPSAPVGIIATDGSTTGNVFSTTSMSNIVSVLKSDIESVNPTRKNVSGGIGGSGIVSLPLTHMKEEYKRNQYLKEQTTLVAEELYQMSIANYSTSANNYVQNFNASPPTTGPLVGATAGFNPVGSVISFTNLGQGGTIVVNTIPLPQQTYKEYIIKYKLGYKTDAGADVLSGIKTVKFRQNFKHNHPVSGNFGDETVSVNYVNPNFHTISNIPLSLIDYKAEIISIEGKIFDMNPTTNQYELKDYTNTSQYIQYEAKLKVENFKQNELPNHSMPVTYDYNSLNWLLSTESPDEGKSHFVYRNDGQIRFSQNAQQKLNNKISYTNYDKLGRPIESGEYTGTSIGFQDHYNLPTLPGGTTSAHDYREGTSTLPSANCSNQSYIGYDVPEGSIPSIANLGVLSQEFLHGNVSYTENSEVKTWYSYDAYGRVTWILRKYINLPTDQQYKHYAYEYDDRGNVSRFEYQGHKADESFFHEYEYDNNGRLEIVKTSTTGADGSFAMHARYIYYLHGPLKRIEVGDKVQGIDYLYTINGALKSINTPQGISDASKDPGKDGYANTFGKDRFAMTLDYYHGDYRGKGAIKNLISQSVQGPNNLYNGNIKAQRWKRKGSTGTSQSLYAYAYDGFGQLNEATFGAFYPGNETVQQDFSYNNKYKVSEIAYDRNGNITHLKRNGDLPGSNETMDNLSYQYQANSNKLKAVTDAVADATYGDDIDNQTATDNYLYDAIGRLTEDKSQKIRYIYNTEGLVTEVQSTINNLAWVKFYYDDAGHRFKKVQYASSGSGASQQPTATAENTTFYVHDVSGQLLSVYQKGASGSFSQKEIPIMGSSRIGMYKKLAGTNDQIAYELKDHLGNVRETILAKADGSAIATNLNFKSDYYPFGMSMPGLKLNSYRYGYQGEYAEDETGEKTNANTFQLRLYDARIGRWLTTDPKGEFHSPYLAMGNNPLSKVDPDGGHTEDWYFNESTKELEWHVGSGFKEGLTWVGGDDSPNNWLSFASKALGGDGHVPSIGHGSLDGIQGGIQSTIDFFKSLGTEEGWLNLIRGTEIILSPAIDAKGNSYVTEERQDVIDNASFVINKLDEFPSYAYGYGLGYGVVKIGEFILTRKVMPISKELNGFRVLGKASKYTTRSSIDLTHKLGRMSKRRYTFLNNSYTIDRGTFINRNFIIPTGRVIGVGQIQYIQSIHEK
jgi:RHS repeat-associated protein